MSSDTASRPQAYGIGVKDITLLPIGGLARLDRIPEDPRQEFRIAIAGPLVNVAIAIVLAAVSAIVDPDALTSPARMIDDLQDGTWRALIAYLLFANIWLVLFNLIPAFPMDGGRILRSLLAMRMPHPAPPGSPPESARRWRCCWAFWVSPPAITSSFWSPSSSGSAPDRKAPRRKSATCSPVHRFPRS